MRETQWLAWLMKVVDDRGYTHGSSNKCCVAMCGLILGPNLISIGWLNGAAHRFSGIISYIRSLTNPVPFSSLLSSRKPLGKIATIVPALIQARGPRRVIIRRQL